MSGLDIRPASADDFAVAVGWAEAEGWNPGLDDLAAFHAADPQGFLIGWRDGEPVASISVVRYGADFGFLGFYIVRADRRGQGDGIAIWNAGMAHLSGRTIGLDGVVAQQDNYRKSGFALAGRNIRHSGVPAPPDAPGAAKIRPATGDDRAALTAYDRAFFAGPRDSFVAAWTIPAPGLRRTTLVATAGGALRGYGTVRACVAGYKIGPLFADSPGIARDLAAGLVATLPEGATVALDTPEDHADAVALAGAMDLKPVFETARMYRGPRPDIALDRTWGITTFELG